MIKHTMISKILIFLLLLGAIAPSYADEVSAQLDECMRNAAIKRGALGALIGGVLGALAGGKENRGKGAAIGAAAGGVVGGVSGWRSSWKSCSSSFVAAESLLTQNYKDTRSRINYDGQSTILLIEKAETASPIRGQQILPINLQYILMAPEPNSIPAKVTRKIFCKNEHGAFDEIVTTDENLNVELGTVQSKGVVQLPSVNSEMGNQECKVMVSVLAAGLQQSLEAPLLITP